jgi:hypothetical protein
MFTIRRLMIAVAVVASFLMPLRNDELGNFLTGLTIVVGCVAVLARRNFTNGIARFEARGVRLGQGRRILLAMLSTFLASALIGAADLAFFSTYYTHVAIITPRHCHATTHLYIQPFALLTGGIAAWCVVLLARFIIRFVKDKLG